MKTWYAYQLEYRELERQSVENEPIFENDELHKTRIAGALDRNDLAHLRLLLSIAGIAYVDDNGDTLLHHAVHSCSLEALKCLLNIPGVPINALDKFGETALGIASRRYREWAMPLILKGADVNLVATPDGNSPLHLAVEKDWIEVGSALIEHGADLNAVNARGETPLFQACRYGRLESVCMLLYYNVDDSIPDCTGCSPFHVANHVIQTILFDYVFDDEKVPICLCIFVENLKNDSSLIPRLFEIATGVYYESRDLVFLCENLLNFPTQYLKLFLRKFDYAIRDMFEGVNFAISALLSRTTPRSIENLIMLTENQYVYYLIEAMNAAPPWAFDLAHMNGLDGAVELKMQLISAWLVYGVKFDSYDVDNVYVHYGFSPLCKQMLLMDFDKTYKDLNHLMPRLIYDFNMTLDVFFQRPNFIVWSFDLVLEHFSDVRFKKYCLKYGDSSLREKVKMLPPEDVPLLTELARNVARKYIVDAFEIRNYRQFCDILIKLGLSVPIIEILTYEQKLYSLTRDI